MGEAKSIFDLVGLVDNLHEPTPLVNKREAILGIVISFMAVSIICVVLRLYVRFRIVRSAGWDDVFVVLSMISTTLGSVCLCLATNSGLGQHLLLLSKDQLRTYLKTFYVANASYCSSTAFIKISLLLQYLRVYEERSRLRYACVGLAVFTGLWAVPYTVIAWVPCVPVYEFWESNRGAYCYGYGSFKPAEFAGTFESHTAVNMVLDVAVLLLALPMYYQPRTHPNTQASLYLLLLAGIVVNFVSIWRLVTIIEHRATTWPTFDPTWYAPISVVLAAIEVDMAVMCASAPVFWPAVRRGLFGHIFVTKEIEITREQRRLDSLDFYDEDRLELRTTTTGNGDSSQTSLAGGSIAVEADEEAGMGGGGHGRGTASKKRNHYGDRFVISQVDPFKSGHTIATKVEGGSGKPVVFGP